MNDKDHQQDELDSLKSIFFEEFEVDEKEDLPEGKYFAYVDLPDDFKIEWHNVEEEGPEIMETALRFLPPLVLSFKLPKDYPSKSPPDFTLSCQWLNLDQIVKLCHKLDEMWLEEAGNEILFLWALFLKEGAMTFLNISNTLDISILCSQFINSNKDENEPLSKDSKVTCESVKDEKHPDEGSCSVSKHFGLQVDDFRAICEGGRIPLIQRLVDYNKLKRAEAFQREQFTCNICFRSVVGAQCTKFEPCDHVFCQTCVKEYFEGIIREGRVQNIQCPETDCSSLALPSQIKDMVSAENFALYDKLLLAVTLDTMPDVIYCPVKACQYPVIREPNEKLATCPMCGYAFCIYCKMVYHGIEPCRFRANEKRKLVKEYQSASPERQLEMEHKYGKKQLQFLVESTMSEQWINSHSKNCPHCKSSIEKSDGCNKMVCWNCKTNFCWLCLAHLNENNPYDHFTSPSSKCMDMLFHGLLDDDDDDDDDDEEEQEEAEEEDHIDFEGEN